MEQMGGLMILFGVVGLVSTISWIILLISAFKRSLAWGLCALLLWPVSYVYAVLFFREQSKVASVFLGSSLLMMVLAWRLFASMLPDFEADSVVATDERLVPIMLSFQQFPDHKALTYAGREQERYVYAQMVGQASVDEAQRRALKSCREFAREASIDRACQVVALDDRVLSVSESEALRAESEVPSTPRPRPSPTPNDQVTAADLQRINALKAPSPEARATPPAKAPTVYKAVSPDELSRYTTHLARLTLRSGREVEGRIKGTGPNKVDLLVKTTYAYVTVQYELHDIMSAKVAR